MGGDRMDGATLVGENQHPHPTPPIAIGASRDVQVPQTSPSKGLQPHPDTGATSGQLLQLEKHLDLCQRCVFYRSLSSGSCRDPPQGPPTQVVEPGSRTMSLARAAEPRGRPRRMTSWWTVSSVRTPVASGGVRDLDRHVVEGAQRGSDEDNDRRSETTRAAKNPVSCACLPAVTSVPGGCHGHAGLAPSRDRSAPVRSGPVRRPTHPCRLHHPGRRSRRRPDGGGCSAGLSDQGVVMA